MVRVTAARCLLVYRPRKLISAIFPGVPFYPTASDWHGKRMRQRKPLAQPVIKETDANMAMQE